MPRKPPDPAAIVTALAALSEPSKRAAEASKLLAQLAEVQKQVKEIRRAAVQTLVSEGWTYQEIADAIGVERARAYQIGQGMSGSTDAWYEKNRK